ncbi:WASH complex subunit 3-like [Leguminivora glycinivorella]|uniref:WASH complex subunit 3-like n=1 Tax=Leguminivora glycinivorella TaxID=1035111 RepID=UPI00200DC068|nr:WASH complex subunit 3-like [Leguminivora glycinivorella]
MCKSVHFMAVNAVDEGDDDDDDDKGQDYCASSNDWDDDVDIRTEETSSAGPPPARLAPSEELQPAMGEEGDRTTAPESPDSRPVPSDSPEPTATPSGASPAGQSEEDDEFQEALPGPDTESETRYPDIPTENNPVSTTPRLKRNRPKINYKAFF